MLRLQGHFSYIDKYNKLKFTFLDDETKDKLTNHCSGKLPFDDEGFTITLPKHIRQPQDDIKGLVGLDCIIHVKITKYDFKSKLEKNFGERVTGTQIVLDNIRAGTRN